MTIKEFRKLPTGTTVAWVEPPKSPRPGEIIDHGKVVHGPAFSIIKWDDGQETHGADDWALKNVIVKANR